MPVLPQWHVRSSAFRQMCRWQVTPKHAYSLNPAKSEWVDYAVQANVRTYLTSSHANKLTRYLLGNARPQTSQLAEPSWTDPGWKSGHGARWLISIIIFFFLNAQAGIIKNLPPQNFRLRGGKKKHHYFWCCQEFCLPDFCLTRNSLKFSFPPPSHAATICLETSRSDVYSDRRIRHLFVEPTNLVLLWYNLDCCLGVKYQFSLPSDFIPNLVDSFLPGAKHINPLWVQHVWSGTLCFDLGLLKQTFLDTFWLTHYKKLLINWK